MTGRTGAGRKRGEGRLAVGARRLALFVLCFVLVLCGHAPFAGGPANAVAQERPRTIMDMLFGTRAPRQPYVYDGREPTRIQRQRPAKPPRRTKPVRGSRSDNRAGAPREAASAAGAARAAPASDGPVEKSAAARTVLVVGDFMAGSLAGGLADALAANPALKVETTADGSSGLVRDDHFDWVARIGPMIEEKKPAVVVVMLGSNDSQTMRVGSASHDARSAEWVAEYGRRADALAAAVAARSVPLVWVGMPSFRFERMSKDMAFLNELYRKAASTVGGDFVDVWDGFVDANGAFATSGPDIAGQQAKLRNADGITMTPEGARKLAFFAEKPIFRLLGTAAMPDADGPATDGETAAASPAIRPANATSAPLVSFDDPALDGGDVLLGGAAVGLATTEPSPRERLVVSGEPGATPAGRADSFDWNGKTEAVSPLRGTDDVISRGRVELRALRDTTGVRPPADMPSLADAIIADWEAQNAAEADAAKAPASPAAALPPAAEPPAPAISASPFAADQKPL